MPIKIQKILRFVPVINIATMFLWIKMCMVESIKPLDFIKELIKMFLLFIGITVVRITCSFVFKNELLDSVLTYVSIYLYFLSMACVSVGAQERIIARKQHQ